VSTTTIEQPAVMVECPLVTVCLPLVTAFTDTGDTVSDAVNKAALLQLLWDNRDSYEETVMSASEMMRRTGATQRAVRRAMLALRRDGLVSARRSGSYDSTFAYTVNRDAVRALIS
jgi:DNA-binding transcriptional ArsR family regulator